MQETLINGLPREPEVQPDKPLLWVLRDELGLKGTKFGCGVGICGICLVLLDDQPVHACTVPWQQVRGRRITTIEGLAADQDNPVMAAWVREQVPQCGYCQPGQVIAATALLNRVPRPTEEQIAQALSPVLCRCGTYHRIRKAVRMAAGIHTDD